MQDLKTLKTLIEKIDIPLPQVRIEAIITEVRLKEDQATGLDQFSVLFNSNPSDPKWVDGGTLKFTESGIGTTSSQEFDLNDNVIDSFTAYYSGNLGFKAY